MWRYAIVGVAQNSIFYMLSLMLIAFGWQAWQAVLLLNPIAVVVAYLLNRGWSFAEPARELGAERFWRYLMSYAVTYVLAVGAAALLEQVGLPSWLAVLVTIGLAAIGLYLVLNYWVFQRKQQDPA